MKFTLRRNGDSAGAPTDDAPGPAAGPQSTEGGVTPPVASGTVFLGSLRSEVDEVELTAESLQWLSAAVDGVVQAYRNRWFTAEGAAERLRVLRLTDMYGNEWTIGATSRRWHRRLPGGAWRINVPPSADDDELIASMGRAQQALRAFAPASEVTATESEDKPAVAEAVSGAPATIPAAVDGHTPAAVDGYGLEDEVEDAYGVTDHTPRSVPAVAAPSVVVPSYSGMGEPDSDEALDGYLPLEEEQSNTPPAVPAAAPQADAEASAALRRMLAGLSQETGIRIAGVEDSSAGR